MARGRTPLPGAPLMGGARPRKGRRDRRLVVASVVAGVLLLGACSTTPVAVERMDSRTVAHELNRSILTSDTLSTRTRNTLFRHDLVRSWERTPEATIAALHTLVAGGPADPTVLLALAEMSFAFAEDSGEESHLRAAMVYAWMFLFPPGKTSPPRDPFDGRVRAAADIYNRGLARGFALGPEGHFTPADATYELPFGSLEVSFDAAQLLRGERRLTSLVPVSELDVSGLPTRHRTPGIGAPLAASTEHLDPSREYDDYVEPWVKVPVTALLRIDDAEGQLANGRVRGRLTLEFDAVQTTVEIHGEQVALEKEDTASLAYTFAEAPIWQRELGGFLQRLAAVDDESRLDSLTPYRRGAIPVVLVHGTASSSGRWAQMLNELSTDPVIGHRIQPWLFTYDTGNPIPYSAMLLRESLLSAFSTLDPEGRDPALRNVVVIGHSQGGLLTKMTAIDSGDRFWRLRSEVPFDPSAFDAETREIIEKSVFLEPLPQVTRLIFISTPHRGSYIAGNWLAHQLAKLIVLPVDVAKVATEVLTLDTASLEARIGEPETSVLDMTPGTPFVEALWSTPVAPGVHAHSIIPVKDPDVPRDEAEDGVVKYSSAHIEEVASELVVTSAHSCQDNPHSIAEVRRILREHAAAFDSAQKAAQLPTPPPTR
jgi:pimeloyl-ACP methyl ester carboxylesterase